MADDNQQDGDVQNEPDGIQQPDPNTNGTEGQEDGRQAVSYTHLTLPTIA